MSRPLVKVFLSGTRRDLQAYWEAAAEAVRSVDGFEPITMEEGVATPIPPDEWSRREATIPDLYVGLLGRCYGQVPTGHNCSLTEQEYDAAGQAGIDRLVFLTDDSNPDTVAGEDATAHDAIGRFRAKVGRDLVYDKVSSPAEFRETLKGALREWERRTIRGTTCSAEEYYRPWLRGDQNFGHQEDLVAREAELEQLEGFTGSAQRVLILRAPWGQGKSRLLLQFARRSSARIRFIKDDVPLSRESLDISAVDRCILVLEDAHRRNPEECRRLLSFVRSFAPGVKVVLSTRSSGAASLLTDTRELGYEAAEIAHLELKQLSDREQRALVAKILGGDSEVAHVIAKRTKGNVLAGVVTARLFRRGALSLAEIDASEEFRHAVLRSFDAALHDHEREGVDGRFRNVLRLVALAGPLSTDDDAVVAALSDFLKLSPHVVRSIVSDLVEADFLLRRGRFVQVPVDAIAEELRRRSCVSSSGETLGYAEDALSSLWPAVRGRLVANLAELSWELSREGICVDFLRGVWPRLTEAYDSAPATARMALLEELEPVAPFAPTAILQFVRHALPSGLGPDEVNESIRGLFSLDLIHDRLARLLAGVLFHAQHVSDACDLLWEIAEPDCRDPGHHPGSGERILQEAAKYRPRATLERYRAVLSWAKRRHAGPGAIPGRRLVKYLTPLLAREVEYDWSDGDAIHLSVQGLPAEGFGTLRRDTLDFLEELASGEDLSTIAASLLVIGHTLSPSPPRLGRAVGPDELAQWHPEESASLARIQRIRDKHASLVVDICIVKAISWESEHSKNEALRKSAFKVVQDIRGGLVGTLELALAHRYQLHQTADSSRFEEHDRDVAQIAASYARVPADAVESRLRQVHAAMTAADLNPDATAFLRHLASRNSAMAEELLTRLLARPEDPLVASIGGLVAGVAQVDPERAVLLSERILDSRHLFPQRVLADIYRTPAFIEDIGAGKAIRHLDRMLHSPDGRVRQGALFAVGLRNPLPAQERLRLLLAYSVAERPDTGEEWSQALCGDRLIADCADEQLPSVAATLGDAARVGHWGCELIAYLASRVPESTVDMLVSRVRRAGSDRISPESDFGPSNPLALLSRDSRERGLVALGEYIRDDDYRVAHAARVLFGQLASGDRELVRRVRGTWIRSGDHSLIRQAARSLSHEGPEYLFAEEATVVNLLLAAEAVGPSVLEEVEAELTTMSYEGVRVTAPGEESAQDVALRDRATAVASRYPQGSAANRFYKNIARHAQDVITFHARWREERSL